MNPQPTILQLVIVANVGGIPKALIKDGNTPFPMAIECTPRRTEEDWVEDLHDAADKELGKEVGFKIMSHCKETPIIRDYKRRGTRVVVAEAEFDSMDIGMHPENEERFIWVTHRDVERLPRMEEEDRRTLLMALSEN